MSDISSARFLDKSTPPHISTLILLAGASAMVMNMFLPSLPAMTEHFQTDYRVMQLSVALFLAANAVAQIFIGPISDRYGRRPVLIWGFAIYCIATLGCIYAPNVTMFLAFRVMQATVVVAMVLSRAIIRDLYEQDQAASMIGYVTMGMSVVPMLTPALGGLLDEMFGWTATFWFFFGAGLLLIALIWVDLGETNSAKSASFAAQVREYPELLTSPRFWGYALAAAFSSGAFFAYLGGAPFVGSEVYGLSPSALGLYFGSPAVGYFVGNFISGRMSVRIGINRMIVTGTSIASFGMLCLLGLLYAGAGSAQVFFGFMTFVGLANGMVLPNAIAGTLSVRPHLAGTASGLGGALMIGGGAVLAAWAGSMLTPGSGPTPLVWIQLGVSVLALTSISIVIRRARRLNLQG